MKDGEKHDFGYDLVLAGDFEVFRLAVAAELHDLPGLFSGPKTHIST